MKYNSESNKHEQGGLLSWSVIFLNDFGGETSKTTMQTLSNQSTNYMKVQRQNHHFLPGSNESAVSFSVSHDCYSEETWHDYRCEALDKYIAIMSATTYLSFNGCVPIYSIHVIVSCLWWEPVL